MILFNATIVSLDRMDGINRYALELLKRMKDEDWLFAANRKVIDFFQFKRFIEVPESWSVPGFKSNLKRLLWHLFSLPGIIREQGVALYYSPFHEGMTAKHCTQIITVHDLLAVIYPETFPRLKYYFKWAVPRILDASSALVAISESTKKDIQRLYGIEKPIEVIYNGCNYLRCQPRELDIEKTKGKYGIKRYVLFVGVNRAYKNLKNTLIGFSRYSDSTLELVVAGKMEGLNESVTRLPSELGIQERVHFLGFVGDEDLKTLYAGAEAFLFTSLYEGFGFPPLEAMACGCPVIASTAASIPEVCGDAAFYIEPEYPDSIADGIQSVLGDKSLRQSMIEKGFLRLKNFDWDKTVHQIKELIRKWI